MEAKISNLTKKIAENQYLLSSKRTTKNLKHCVVALPFLILESFAPFSAHAKEADTTTSDAGAYSFNTSLIRGFNAHDAIDINTLIHSSGPAEGVYYVDFAINGQYQKTLNMTFSLDDNKNLNACIPVKLLQESGVKEEVLKEIQDQSCVVISQAIAGASEDFNFNKLVLNLLIPGTAMLRHDFSDAPTSQWNYGESVLFTNYSANYYHTKNKNSTSNTDSSSFISLTSGANLGRWRLRNQSYYSKSNNQPGKFNTVSTYARRALPSLRSELTIGQTFTSNRLFDGISFRGVKLESDNRMLPRRQRGYAPEIHGVAETNARVKIRQGDSLLYESTVAPGPFVINDLIPNTYSGELHVEVVESDGRTNYFTVPYSAVSESLRPGLSMYSITLGQTDKQNASKAKFSELTYERGISNTLTLNGGLQIADNHYTAGVLGAVFSTKFGALGLNATYSTYDDQDVKNNNKDKKSGWMVKGSYSRRFDSTNTNVTLAAYRYATEGFMTLNDSLNKKNKNHSGGYTSSRYQQRQRFEISANQNLSSWGSLYANAAYSQYYNNNRTDKQYQIGYANSHKHFSYTLSLLHQKNNHNSGNDVVTLGVSIPLNSFSNPATLSTYLSHNQSGGGYLQTRLNGSLGENRDINYNLNFNHDLKQKSNSAGINLNQSTSYGTFGASYMHQSSSNQISASAQGAAVIHSGGLTLGPYVGDTFAIVEAKDAQGASVDSSQGAIINRSGYALVPSMSAYSFNQVTLNPTNMSSHVELANTQKQIVPTSGAVVKVKFETSKGYPILVSSKHNDKALPLGASVFNKKSENIGIVGQGSRAYARVKDEAGSIIVRWGKEETEQCEIHYQLPKKQIKDNMILLEAPCI